jgi:hypothetical protein
MRNSGFRGRKLLRAGDEQVKFLVRIGVGLRCTLDKPHRLAPVFGCGTAFCLMG